MYTLHPTELVTCSISYSTIKDLISTYKPPPNHPNKSKPITMTQKLTNQARSTYRALLRELPKRSKTNPSPIHARLQSLFRSEPQTASTTNTPSPTSSIAGTSGSDAIPFSTPDSEGERSLRLQEAEQFAQYAKAQRTYSVLLERYNPGMNLDEEERIRLTARRVGMDLPELYEDGEQGKKSE